MSPIIAVNIIDLYHSSKYDKPEVVKYIYDNFSKADKTCIPYEKGIEKYYSDDAVQLIIRDFNPSLCECDYDSFIKDNKCINCVCHKKHESHYVVCCLDRSIDSVLTVRCNCDDLKEGVRNECVASGVFDCRDLENTRCWLLCVHRP